MEHTQRAEHIIAAMEKESWIISRIKLFAGIYWHMVEIV